MEWIDVARRWIPRPMRSALQRFVALSEAKRRWRRLCDLLASVLFQECLDVKHEWHLVRIGDTFFGHPKGRVGSYDSGLGRVEWDVPVPRHFAFLNRVTVLGPFTGISVDNFRTRDGGLLVNEMRAVFGASTLVKQMRVAGVPRQILRMDSDRCFEPGDFTRNACASARVLGVPERW